MKKIIRIALCLLLVLVAVPQAAFAAENAIDLFNGDFEIANENLPDYWYTESYDPTLATSFSVVNEGREGGQCARIDCTLENDARFVQSISVEPNSLYRISGWVRTEGIPEGSAGASVSVLDCIAEIPEACGEEWQQLVYYAETGDDQDTLKLACRLGRYGGVTVGTAWFDDIAVEAVQSVPENGIYVNVAPVAASVNDAPQDEKAADTGDMLPVFMLTGIYVAAAVILLRTLLAGSAGQKKNVSKWGIIVAVTVALGIRVVLAMTQPGYAPDNGCFSAWSERLLANGPWHFYAEDYFCDYPVGYLYVLWGVGALRELLGIAFGSPAYYLLLRLPAMLADIVLSWLIYRMACKRMPAMAAFGVLLFCLFNPASIADSAAWGQIDSVLALLLVLSFASLADKRYLWAAVWYGIAMAVKPQGALFLPILLFPPIRDIINGDRKKIGTVFAAIGLGLAVWFVLFIPFWGDQPNTWLLEKYFATGGSYPYWSLNAANLYAMLGKNWYPMPETLLGLPRTAFTIAITAVTWLAAGVLYFRGRHREDIWMSASIVVAGSFILAPMMHERYLNPVIWLLAAAFVRRQDRRFIPLCIAFSVSQFLSMVMTLQQIHIPSNDQWLIILSGGTVAAFAWLVYVGTDIAAGSVHRVYDAQLEAQKVQAKMRVSHQWLHGDIAEPPKFSRRDWILMLSLTAVYAVIAIVNLGVAKAPETMWEAGATAGSTVLKLESVQQIDKVLLYSGVGDGTVEVDVSTDGVNYQCAVLQENNYTSCYKWSQHEVYYDAQYVKVTVTGGYVPLGEIGITVNGEPATLFVAEGSSALTDEQGTLPERPGYENSSYFDEIYHARTAKEYYDGTAYPYENTHPPLGKLFIALGIAVFGMNPFGWRIVGTLFGIAMIPAMYAFAFAVFRKTKWAFVAAFLMAFDFMHFTQTRIATIDVYGVFFIIMMFYFMYRYSLTDYLRQPLKHTLKYLLLSGLMFGLGTASKWIALYGGAGLAVIFFWTVYRRYMEFKCAKRQMESASGAELKQLKAAADAFVPNTVKTLAWCLLFFIAIPAVVYAASYLPIVLQEGQSFSYIFTNQESMYNYHSQLVATHYFQSSWYSWPLILKPIWYFVNNYLEEGMRSTISALGNPAVWWTALVAMLFMIVYWVRNPASEDVDRGQGRRVLCVAMLSQYLPWVLVSRCTFIYHYFGTVPFLIIVLTWALKLWTRGRKAILFAYLAVVVLLFALFYPVISGAVVPEVWINALKWLPDWTF